MLITCLSAFVLLGQTNYTVHANIIYRFTKYIDWPEHKKNGDFIIGIVGESPVFAELVALTTNKTVGHQKIVIKQHTGDASSYNCHILFVSEDESGRLSRIVSATAGQPILIVSERYGLIGKGSCINFVVNGDHLELQFGKSNIKKRDLKIASELLSLGTVVN